MVTGLDLLAMSLFAVAPTPALTMGPVHKTPMMFHSTFVLALSDSLETYVSIKSQNLPVVSFAIYFYKL